VRTVSPLGRTHKINNQYHKLRQKKKQIKVTGDNNLRLTIFVKMLEVKFRKLAFKPNSHVNAA